VAGLIDPHAVLCSIGEAVYDWDMASDRISWSANVRTLLQVTNTAALSTGTAYDAMIDPISMVTRGEALAMSEGVDAGAGVVYRMRYALGIARGKVVWVEDTGRWFGGADGRPAFAHGVVRLTEPPGDNDELNGQSARIDQLTKAFNRGAFNRVLDEELRRVAKQQQVLVFLLVSIDDLAGINRDYGYDAADEVLAGLATRLRSCIRGRDRLVRYAGNKLGLLLSPCNDDVVPQTAERVLAAAQALPFQTRAGAIAASVHLGGVVAPRHAATAADVMHRAAEALAEAKGSPGKAFHIYEPDAARTASRHRNAVASDDILAALNERRLRLAFEPVLGAETGEVAFHEALVRLVQPTGEITGAGGIIPAAERLGLIRLVDHRVLDMAVETLVANPLARLSINLSMRTAVDAEWHMALQAHLAAAPGVASRLIVEVTETAAIDDLEATARLISTVKALGVGIAIDDFGSGHSSFRALRSLPVDILKIDGAFVQNLTRSADDRFFVRTQVDLAHHLGVRTVAEWVQDEESARMLREWGVNYLQGEHCGLAGMSLAAPAPARRLLG
jgi:diguanylate cyclase (GGDEF)-like protein